VKTEKKPAGYRVGWAVALKAPWSASTLTRTAWILPSRPAAIAPLITKSRANPVDIRFSERSSIHLTDRPVRIAALIAHT
jgi:hypothetical protein